MITPAPDHLQRRAQLNALAASLPHALWRGDALGAQRSPVVGTGYPALNTELPGGGWPLSALTELLWAQSGAGEFRLLGPTLRSLAGKGKSIIVLAPPYRLCAPALAQLGVDLSQVLLIESVKPVDRLWAIEQVLKSASFGALLCWLPHARADHLRRLQLAAAGAEGLAFVFRPQAALHESSPAPLRMLCQARSDGCLEIDVFKRRGPASAAPVILPAQLPKVIARALLAPRSLPVLPLGAEHALDRRLPAAAAAGSRLPSLA